MSTTKTLGEVTAADIGRRVRVRSGDALHEGVLTEVEAKGAIIDERDLSSTIARFVIGSVTAWIGVDGWRSGEMRLDTPIEVLA